MHLPGKAGQCGKGKACVLYAARAKGGKAEIGSAFGAACPKGGVSRSCAVDCTVAVPTGTTPG